MTFAQGMFLANYIILSLTENPRSIVITFILMLIWGAVAILEYRANPETC